MRRGGGRGRGYGRRGGNKRKGKGRGGTDGGEPRVRLPREGEILGIVTAMLGGSRMRVECKDGKERMGRIPGKLRNRIWVKEGDAVLLRPWEIEGDKKGDIIWRYLPLQARILRNKGYL